MILLNNQDVQQLLTPGMARRALLQAYQDLAAGNGVCRPRIDIRIPHADPERFYQWGTMEGGSTRGYFAIRMKSDVIYEQDYNGARTQEKFASRPGLFCGLILLTDIRTAEPLAILNDGHLQHMRVAADSAIGTDIMARPESATLAMIGSGGMARAHLESLLEVRPIKTVRVFSPTVANRVRYAEEMSRQFGIRCTAVDTPEQACRGADILASCTDSSVPVIREHWLEPGMHVISIGGRPDDAARKRFDRVLRLGTAPAPVGRPELGTADEYLGYVAQPDAPNWQTGKGGRRAPQVTGQGDDVYFSEILSGRCVARSSPDEITYSERGNIQGAQFYSVAGAVYEAALQHGVGRQLPTDWFLQDIRD